MADYFFDTSALLERYVHGPYTRTVSSIISNSRNTCFIADWTVLELASSLGKRMRAARDEARKQGHTYHLRREYDKRDRRFVRDIAEGSFQVRNTNFRDILHARDLIRFSGIIKGYRIGTGDAILAACCLNLAHDLNRKIVFYTADKPLYAVLFNHDHFRSVLCLRLLGTPRDPNMPNRNC